jgi:hypothetical protein
MKHRSYVFSNMKHRSYVFSNMKHGRYIFRDCSIFHTCRDCL